MMLNMIYVFLNLLRWREQAADPEGGRTRSQKEGEKGGGPVDIREATGPEREPGWKEDTQGEEVRQR